MDLQRAGTFSPVVQMSSPEESFSLVQYSLYLEIGGIEISPLCRTFLKFFVCDLSPLNTVWQDKVYDYYMVTVGKSPSS